MSDPKEQRCAAADQRESRDLELEPETVKDLDVSDDRIGQIRGGCSFTPMYYGAQR